MISPLLVGLLLMMLSGCGVSLLPTTKDEVRSPWNSFAEAKSAFDRVVVEEADMRKLQDLGFDPFFAPPTWRSSPISTLWGASCPIPP
mgnify:FL=1